MTQSRHLFLIILPKFRAVWDYAPISKPLKALQLKVTFLLEEELAQMGPWKVRGRERGSREEQSTGNLPGGAGQEDYTTCSAPSPTVIPRPSLFKLLSNSNPSCTEASLH